MTACTSASTSPVDANGVALDVLSDVACLRDVVTMISRVHPINAQVIRDKIAAGLPLDSIERQVLLEGIDRLRAAGKCLAKR